MPALLEADIAAAVEGIPGVDGIYALAAVNHPDAYELAIVVAPYSQRTIVELHFAIVSATDTRKHAGRILYANGDAHAPLPLSKARRIAPTRQELEAARVRIATRRAGRDDAKERIAIDEAFRKLAVEVFEENRETGGSTAQHPPYRGGGVSFDLRTGVLEVVADPFPSKPRAWILVIDEDTDTAQTLRRTSDFQVTHVDEGWAAVDAVEKHDYDAVLCKLRVGGMSGATLHRMIVKTRPELAPRIAFVASARAVAGAPPSSALGRVLPLPVTIEAVRRLME